MPRKNINLSDELINQTKVGFCNSKRFHLSHVNIHYWIRRNCFWWNWASRKRKNHDNRLINGCSESLENIFAAFKPLFFQSFHKWQHRCECHTVLFVFLCSIGGGGGVLTLFIRRGFGANTAALIHQAFVAESPQLSPAGFHTIRSQRTWMILFKRLKMEPEYTYSCIWVSVFQSHKHQNSVSVCVSCSSLVVKYHCSDICPLTRPWS